MIKRKKKTVEQRTKERERNFYDGIQFKSPLEIFCYKELKKLNVVFAYEPTSFEILPKFKKDLKVYQPNTKGNIKLYKCEFKNAIYTPDFIINDHIIIETKGYSDEKYVYRRKLFFSQIETYTPKIEYFFEPSNNKQVSECIEIIKTILKL